MDFPVNEDLVSGLLTALNQFTIVEFKQGIESIEMGGLRWVYILDKDTNLLFIAADSKGITTETLRSRLDIIRHTFIQQYAHSKNSWKGKWTGNVEVYRPFENVIDEYYTQWKQAEKITNVAEFFDILGIFQQMLNLLINVIEGRLKKKNKIYQIIEDMFKNYSESEVVQKNPELGSITFERKIGINVIGINPMNCDMLVVEKEIINLIRRITEALKEEEGYYPCLKYFVEENIFDYLISNFSLLTDLNLFIFLIKLFLLR
ncbi:hypothetical protein LCGC14_0620900 [marine sediment metagenome]|uniref:Uncharacterized protein n=1 Tax=marine sediment metagenome TaxID=412755 RepID=A0A0F9TR93_9ZZZZ|nr:MAG: hypothetical protein Lokiarch_37000 [Candidatus Lokiarchaeum sp. GC14_75]